MPLASLPPATAAAAAPPPSLPKPGPSNLVNARSCLVRAVRKRDMERFSLPPAYSAAARSHFSATERSSAAYLSRSMAEDAGAELEDDDEAAPFTIPPPPRRPRPKPRPKPLSASLECLAFFVCLPAAADVTDGASAVAAADDSPPPLRIWREGLPDFVPMGGVDAAAPMAAEALLPRMMCGCGCGCGYGCSPGMGAG